MPLLGRTEASKKKNVAEPSHQQQVSGGGVDRHGLVLEGVGLDQLLLLLPALLLAWVVVVQLVQALEERGTKGERERRKRLALKKKKKKSGDWREGTALVHSSGQKLVLETTKDRM